MESLPDTLKCGSLMCGNEIFMPEKNPLMASTTPLTLFFAASIGVVIADFIPFHTEVAVDLIPLKILVTVLFTELNTLVTVDLIALTGVVTAVFTAFHTVVAVLFIALNTVVTTDLMALTTVVTTVFIAFHTVVNTVLMAFITVLITDATALMTVVTLDLIASQTAMMISLQFSQIKRNGRVMISTADSRMEPISMMPVWTMFLMVSQIPVKKETMPFQIPSKKVFILVQTSFQLVPNQPRTTSATPLITFRILVKKLLIPFQMEEKISFTPVHAWDQFPVKMPIKTSRIPVMTPVTVERILAM